MLQPFDFSKRFTPKRKAEFAQMLIKLSRQIDMKVSSRGWCYIMEQEGHIDKGQFNRVADAINDLRREGLLPVDFVAEESARSFTGVDTFTSHWKNADAVIEWLTRDLLDGAEYYRPDWWEGEEYYIQCVVEKIDLVTLFEPVCRQFHIPIANSKGWASISQRAEYARRFKEAEDMGLKCVLIYCGDHDADGLRISDTLRTNLEQVSEVTWADGQRGYDPADLIIDRFGLNFDFIQRNRFTWIDNLITGSDKNLASPSHPNHKLPYVQEYLRNIGERKCEANALVTNPAAGRQLIRDAIEKWVGVGGDARFEARMQARRDEYNDRLKEVGLYDIITNFRKGQDDE